MGSSQGFLKLASIVLLICAMINTWQVDAAIPCSDVNRSLIYCKDYLIGGSLSQRCCTGTKSLNARAKSTADRRQVCSCLKTGFQRHPAFKFDRAKSLPGACGVNIRYNITPNVDCSRVT